MQVKPGLRARFIATGTTTVLALTLALMAGAAPAAATSTGLGGTLVAEDGSPVAACVSAYTTTYEFAASTCANDLGQWELPDLNSGTPYKIQVLQSGLYLGKWALDGTSFDNATVYTAPIRFTTTMRLGGRVSGTLTDSTGTPVEAASVTVLDAATRETLAFTATGSDGGWEAVTPPGDVKVHFEKFPADLWATGRTSIETASVFTVLAGATVRVDDHFLPMAEVTGRVVDQTTSSPIQGICVSLVDPATYPIDGTIFGYGCTDAAGRYRFTPWAVGRFALLFEDPSGRYVAEFAANTRHISSARLFTIVAGRTTTRNEWLAPAGTVTGLVVNASTGAPIAGVCPEVLLGRTSERALGQHDRCSGADGRYTVSGLSTETLTLRLVPEWRSGLSPVWYRDAVDQSSAVLFGSRAGRTISLDNVALVPGGIVTGRVTDPSGDPIEGAWVGLPGVYGGRTVACGGPLCAQTGPDGRYSINAPAGRYRPIVYATNTTYAPEWSGDATSRADAVPITVRRAATTTFNATLVAGGHLGGTMYLANGTATSDYTQGQVFTAGGDFVGEIETDSTPGHFTSTALPAGSLVLNATLVATGQTGWFDAAMTRANATVISLSQGQDKELAFHLP
jgi:hypothetical protein